MARMHDTVRPEALIGYLEKRQQLVSQMRNWSREGVLKTAAGLRSEARKKFDFSLAESYAAWMAGAWLETSVRSSDQARDVHRRLELLAREALADREVQVELKRRIRPGSSSAGKLDIKELRREADYLFHVAAKIYFFSGLFERVEEGEVELAVARRGTDSERGLLMALLLGIWHGIVHRAPEGDVDDSEAAASIARWFAIPALDAAGFIEDLREDRSRQEIKECCLEASRAVSQSPKDHVQRLVEVVEAIRNRARAG
jgi:hypothetical protein